MNFLNKYKRLKESNQVTLILVLTYYYPQLYEFRIVCVLRTIVIVVNRGVQFLESTNGVLFVVINRNEIRKLCTKWITKNRTEIIGYNYISEVNTYFLFKISSPRDYVTVTDQ